MATLRRLQIAAALNDGANCQSTVLQNAQLCHIATVKVLEKEKRRYKLKWIERHIQDLDITAALKEHTFVRPTRRYGYSMRAKESN